MEKVSDLTAKGGLVADDSGIFRHPNQDRWDRQQAHDDANHGSTDQQRTNLRRTQERLEVETDPSQRRTLEIKAKEQAAALDDTGRGRKL